MASDNPSHPPNPDSTDAHIAPAAAKQDVEYDDFGLPVRKRRPRTPVEDSEDEDEDEDDFKDAVAGSSEAASQNDGAAKNKDKAGAERAVESIVEHIKERDAAQANDSGGAQAASATVIAAVNGQVKVEEVEVVRDDDDKAPETTRNAAQDGAAPNGTTPDLQDGQSKTELSKSEPSKLEPSKLEPSTSEPTEKLETPTSEDKKPTEPSPDTPDVRASP